MSGVTLGDWLRGGLDDFGERASNLLGLKLQVDPSIFILGEDVLRVQAPDLDGSPIGGVGRLAHSGRHSFRLYPASALAAPGAQFLEVAEGPEGVSARWFAAVLTEGLSGGAALAEWALPPAGKLGGSQITGPAGDAYDRVAPPGSGWAMPPTRYERVESGRQTDSRRHSGHLFQRRTAAPPPAPEHEFLWAEKIEYRSSAWVMLSAGVALDPAAVSLY